ncbi:TPA: integrase, partial [Klebsiella pneumoniae]
MKTGQTTASSSTPVGFPDADSLAALRGWYAGLSSRAAVEHYLAARKAAGQSARGMLGHIRRQLIVFANSRHRPDLADVFQHAPEERQGRAGAVERAIRLLPTLPAPKPQISDSIDQWLSPRTVRALQAYGIHTLSALTVR